MVMDGVHSPRHHSHFQGRKTWGCGSRHHFPFIRRSNILCRCLKVHVTQANSRFYEEEEKSVAVE